MTAFNTLNIFSNLCCALCSIWLLPECFISRWLFFYGQTPQQYFSSSNSDINRLSYGIFCFIPEYLDFFSTIKFDAFFFLFVHSLSSALIVNRWCAINNSWSLTTIIINNTYNHYYYLKLFLIRCFFLSLQSHFSTFHYYLWIIFFVCLSAWFLHDYFFLKNIC